MEQITLLQLFSALEPDDALRSVLAQVEVCHVDLDAEERRIRVKLQSERYLDLAVLKSLRTQLSAIYRLRDLRFSVQYPVEALEKAYAACVSADYAFKSGRARTDEALDRLMLTLCSMKT